MRRCMVFQWVIMLVLLALADPKQCLDGEDPSGIDTLRTDRQLGEHAPAWFSIDGRRLNGEPARKGVYIHNGKKIVKSF